MDTKSPTIPAETARNVLWRYDRLGGTQSSPFTEHLLAAIEHADVRNRAILREAYPELSAALHLARYDEEGITKLQRIAAGAGPLGCPCGDTAGPFDLKTGRCDDCARPIPLDGVA